MPHTIKEKKQLLTRVRRIKGQADALEKALEQGTDCSAVLQQIAAIRGAVNGLMAEVLEGHIREHLGVDDISPEQVRKIAGKDFIVGVTAKTVEQARRAESAGADYLGVGAVFPSPTKKNAIRITTEQLHEICTAVSVPAVAITSRRCAVNGRM